MQTGVYVGGTTLPLRSPEPSGAVKHQVTTGIDKSVIAIRRRTGAGTEKISTMQAHDLPVRFQTQRKVRFADVDPARIAFYPRYFEMLNGIVEDWFEAMGWGFGEMHLERDIGIPTRRLEAEFEMPSRLGDRLDLKLSVVRVGRTSLDLHTRFFCGEEMRWQVAQTLVLVDMKTGRPVPWPDDLRARLEG